MNKIKTNVIKETFTRDVDNYSPKIEIRDNAAYAIFRLSKLGYGTINELMKMSSSVILQLLNFEKFNNDCELVVRQKIKRENGS